jgi:hypothetical protein
MIRFTLPFPKSRREARARAATSTGPTPVASVIRAGIVALMLLLTTGALQAQAPAPPRVEPNPAPAGALLRVYFDGVNAYCSGYESSEVSQQGFTVTLTVRYQLVLCGTPPPGDLVLPLGRFGPGNYTLVYQAIFESSGPAPIETTGFTVYPAASIVPTTQRSVLVLLAVMLAALGAWHAARRD